ncbi:MAG: hypothetical protein NTW28_34945, partial [Candidatus Solibacter sp.]|nr:hypothetical protein [Candidatus Solibacter sp.]
EVAAADGDGGADDELLTNALEVIRLTRRASYGGANRAGDGHLAFVLDSNKCAHKNSTAGNPEIPASCDPS